MSKPSALLLTICSIAVPGSGHLILRRKRVGVFWILLTVTFYTMLVVFRAFTHSELRSPVWVIGTINCSVAAWTCAFQGRRFGRVPRWVRFIPVVLISALWTLLVAGQAARASGLRVFAVESDGMAPFMRSGDHIVVDMRYYARHKPARNDIISIYREQPQPFGGILVVKRVIGVAGDRIEIVDDAIIRNGAHLEEPYARHDASRPAEPWSRNIKPVLIPQSKLFLLGDNRDDSLDSRSPDVGFYDESDVKGKVIEVFHSTVK